MTRDQMIQCGRDIDAQYVIISTPHNGNHPFVDYVLKGEKMVPKVGETLDANCVTEIIKLG